MNRTSAAVSMLATLAALALWGCSGDAAGGGPMGDPTDDAGTTPEPEPGNDAATTTPAHDAGGIDSALPEHADAGNPAPAHDAGTTKGDGGGAALGQACKVDSDCASGMCRGFRQNTVLLCTAACTPATQTTDCPVPPTAGTCTPKGYCKFN